MLTFTYSITCLIYHSFKNFLKPTPVITCQIAFSVSYKNLVFLESEKWKHYNEVGTYCFCNSVRRVIPFPVFVIFSKSQMRHQLLYEIHIIIDIQIIIIILANCRTTIGSIALVVIRFIQILLLSFKKPYDFCKDIRLNIAIFTHCYWNL